ncbi:MULTISPECIES: FGGY-family carbohydrate kinase [Arthrobacter]|uniref:Carbohydrate kinase n=1 Tax=Arthrobacter terricola TaxID=2547396 RepID=A0A4R5K6M7_9MICC|nr:MULTISPECIES: FGGY-family carbohydrate kinase [Arthrobacter]MBT8163459.1 carbohydrate kinase [Arthrobacter sp. GN70]TDF89767.1 carbohydrate kinase [Arthrobacter terricola]
MGLTGQADYLLGIDAGQTFTKAVLFTLDGQETASASTSIPTTSLRPSWQERDMDLTWERTASAIRRCLNSAGVNPSQILAVGLSGHGDGLYLVDAAGKPVRPAILATDARAFAEAKRLGEGPTGMKALALTGQVPAAYSPSALLAWLQRNEPETLDRADKLLHCKDWLRFRLTGKIATDPTEASHSFTDVATQNWSEEVLGLYGLENLRRLLPSIVSSASVAGTVSETGADRTGLAAGTPVITGAHDVDAAAVGIGAGTPGAMSITMGTFSINQIVSEQPVSDSRWQARTFVTPGQYLHMSTSPSSASNFEWATKVFGGDGTPDYAAAVSSAHLEDPGSFEDSPLFLPYLYGAPQGVGDPGGTFSRIRGSHGRADLFRAVLEGIVFNHRWHVDALKERFRIAGAVRLCGGGAKSPAWSQLMANVLQLPIEVTDAEEAGARGAAIMAGIGVGVYGGLEEASSRAVQVVRTHHPDPAWKALLDGRYALFLRLMTAARESAADSS